MSVHALRAEGTRAASARRRPLDGAWVLSLATAASGALAYLFTIVTARTLSASEYGLIAVLWAATFLVATHDPVRLEALETARLALERA